MMRPSMETKPVRAVYRLLKIARETGRIPWSWIVGDRTLESIDVEQPRVEALISYPKEFRDGDI